MLSSEDIDSVIDEIFNWVDDQFHAGNFHQVDKFVSMVNPELMHTDIAIAVLTITKHAADKCPARSEFLKSTETVLRKLHGEKVAQEMLKGL